MMLPLVGRQLNNTLSRTRNQAQSRKIFLAMFDARAYLEIAAGGYTA